MYFFNNICRSICFATWFQLRYAAMALRTKIMAMPPSRIPSPTSDHTLKDNAPNIPYPLWHFFFSTHIGGMQSETRSDEANERKAVASASSVCVWKHQSLGLGLGTLTGSKCYWPCWSFWPLHQLWWSEETEMAYSFMFLSSLVNKPFCAPKLLKTWFTGGISFVQIW